MTEKERQEINNAIAENNRAIKLDYQIVNPTEPKYYEVKLTTINEMAWYGNNSKLVEGTVFKSTTMLPANTADISFWLHPMHLENSGLNYIAYECCVEITKEEYELKSKAVK